jgi:hypothetical protein
MTTPTLNPTRITLLTDTILHEFRGAPAGHCARVDFLERAEALAICREIAQREQHAQIMARVLTAGNDDAHDPDDITTDQAIEQRNRKQTPLCLFVPSDLVDAAASSIANAFAPIDGRKLHAHIRDHLRSSLPPPAQQMVRAVFNQLTGPLKVGEEQKLDFVCAITERVEANQLEHAGLELWRVGLIADASEDFINRLDKNRRCVMSLKRPAKMQATASERIQSTRVDGETATLLRSFFWGRAMNDVPAWSRALAMGEGITFDRWVFPKDDPSDIRQVILKPFVDANGKVQRYCKLLQPDGVGGSLIAACGEKGSMVVRWETDPPHPQNLDRWLIEMVLSGGERSDTTVDLPSREIDGAKRTVTLKLNIELEDEPLDSAVCIRVTPLDFSGNEIVEAVSGESLAERSDEFFLGEDDRISGPSAQRESRKIVPTLAYGRLEAALSEKGHTLIETQPLWTSKELDYFSMRLNERRVVNIGLSGALVILERQVISNPRSGGRFVLNVADVRPVVAEAEDEACFAPRPLPDYSRESWAAFWREREHFFTRLSKAHPRDLMAAADWSEPLASAAVRYAQSYRKLIEDLVNSQSSEDELLDALALDTLLLRLGSGNDTEEALVILPTFPLRAAWIAGYARLMAHWEQQVLTYPLRERKHAIDLPSVAFLGPANTPAFAYHPEASHPFIFFQNLSFYYGVALPARVPDPRRRFSDIACILGVESEQREVDTIQPERLAEHIQRFAALHPVTDTLVTTLINTDRGDFFAEALKHMLQPGAQHVEETDQPEEAPRFHITAYVPDVHKSNVQALERLRLLHMDHRSRGSDHFLPPLSTTLRPMQHLTQNGSLPDAHLAIITDLTRPDVVAVAPASGGSEASSFSLYGLMNRFIPQFVVDPTGFFWRYRIIPEAPVRPEPHPAGAKYSDTLFDLHTALLQAGGRVLNEHDQFHPALEVMLRRDEQDLLEYLHASADWIITMDRFFVLDYYDSPNQPALSTMAKKYLLDYTPEFAEGLGHRMMVTTAWRDEIGMVLARAMDDLGFTAVEESINHLLHYLKTVSGRLALQALESSNNAAAAVGLGVVTAWLQANKRLSQAVLVPVDPHPRLFTRHGSAMPVAGERRCDLVLFALKKNIVEATFIEVKWRRGIGTIDELARDMVLQMEGSATVLRERFFNPHRLDGALQRAYLANVLRFYLERGQRYGLIDAETAQPFLANLTRLEKSGLATPEKSGLELRTACEGYIVSLNDAPRKPVVVDDARIILLTARDFEQKTEFITTAPQEPSEREESMPDAEHTDEEAAASPETRTEEGTPQRSDDAEPTPPAEPGSDESLPPSADVVIPLGTAGQQQIDWCPGVKGSPHLFIIGIPGQGKSWAVTRMLCLLGQQHVPALVLDFHGQFADPQGAFVQAVAPSVIDAAQGLPFSPFEYTTGDGSGGWKANSYALAEIFGSVAGLGDMQRDVVYTAISEAYRAHGFDDTTTEQRTYPTLGEVLQRIEQREQASRTANVIARCRPLLEMDLFRPTEDSPDLLSLVQHGLVIDLHNLYVETLQMAAGAFVLRKIYKDMFRWGTADRLRLAIVLDEAHRLARDVTLPKIMKEGRKFGIAVVVASQGMSDFHPDILSNAGTKVLFRTNYPESRKIAGFIRSRQGQDLAARLEQLPVGSAYVQTSDMAYGSVVPMYALESG